MAERQMMLEGRWQEMRGRVKEAWGVLTDDELDRIEGRWDRLVGAIRQKTGETVERIEEKLDELIDSVEQSETRADDDA